jgi:hypothetical protein
MSAATIGLRPGLSKEKHAVKNICCGPVLLFIAVAAVVVICEGCPRGDATSEDWPAKRENTGAALPDPQPEHKSSDPDKLDLRLDQQTTEKIAEIVLIKAYGPDVLDERPWIVTTTTKGFKFTGTSRYPAGGVAEIEISKRNGAVTSIFHGK